MKLIFTVFTFCLSFTAYAEIYEIPEDAWYQVAKGETIVCQSGDVCDIDLSQRYRLLRFTFDGVTETQIGGTSGNSSNSPSVTRVAEICIFDSPNFGDCAARCPQNTLLTGGSCAIRVTALINGDTNPSGDVIATASYTDRNSYSCVPRIVDVPNLGNFGAAFVTASAMCLTRP